VEKGRAWADELTARKKLKQVKIRSRASGLPPHGIVEGRIGKKKLGFSRAYTAQNKQAVRKKTNEDKRHEVGNLLRSLQIAANWEGAGDELSLQERA